MFWHQFSTHYALLHQLYDKTIVGWIYAWAHHKKKMGVKYQSLILNFNIVFSHQNKCFPLVKTNLHEELSNKEFVLMTSHSWLQPSHYYIRVIDGCYPECFNIHSYLSAEGVHACSIIAFLLILDCCWIIEQSVCSKRTMNMNRNLHFRERHCNI